ncbi:o-succinylbenzoate synthase [Rubrobacter marinus]|uniref:o-succinylbenzoate synthase n=1 Tax=Rubrobacter marinus TaxID=2653852 RepID=A0A6G8Q0D4_9ACTN|nr:o-succinylbenzoate synthase [Rubrobacter marinus]QIN79931.1 o-succinylbenzoate synthase [Rubrobacter marinus]
MKVTGFGLYRFRLPLTAPLVLKGETVRHREGLLLRLDGAGGAVGWGEASPLPGFSREVLPEAARELHGLAESVVGRGVPEARPGAGLDGAPGFTDAAPSVRFGCELALWNLYAAARGVALPEVVSPRFRAVVPANGLLAGSPTEVLGGARRMRAEGYEAAKLKVGGRPVGEDVALVRTVREALGGDVSLRLDANRAWGTQEALEFARGIEGVGIEYLEEPLEEPADLGSFARACGVPVALDESLVGMAPEALGAHRYAVAVVIKPSLIGGLSRALDLANRALDLGMRPVVSSAYESGVGTAALVALAAGIGDEGVPAGLDTYRRLAGDVIEPRLPLPAPRIDVRETVEAAHDVVPGRLSPEAEPIG